MMLFTSSENPCARRRLVTVPIALSTALHSNSSLEIEPWLASQELAPFRNG